MCQTKKGGKLQSVSGDKEEINKRGRIKQRRQQSRRIKVKNSKDLTLDRLRDLLVELAFMQTTSGTPVTQPLFFTNTKTREWPRVRSCEDKLDRAERGDSERERQRQREDKGLVGEEAEAEEFKTKRQKGKGKGHEAAGRLKGEPGKRVTFKSPVSCC